MDAITIQERTEDPAVRQFLDREWGRIDPVSWTPTPVALTAERDGVILGVALGGCTAGVAHLGELMVAEGTRNSGVGARLLAAFEAWAAAQGAHLCTLNTNRDRPAERFYLRHGWAIAWVVEDYYHHGTYAWLTKAVGREKHRD